MPSQRRSKKVLRELTQRQLVKLCGVNDINHRGLNKKQIRKLLRREWNSISLEVHSMIDENNRKIHVTRSLARVTKKLKEWVKDLREGDKVTVKYRLLSGDIYVIKKTDARIIKNYKDDFEIHCTIIEDKAGCIGVGTNMTFYWHKSGKSTNGTLIRPSFFCQPHDAILVTPYDNHEVFINSERRTIYNVSYD